MKYLLVSQLFAETYNCGTYGTANYNENQCATTSTGSVLSNTGTDVAVGIGIGIVLIVIAAVVLLKNRKNKK